MAVVKFEIALPAIPDIEKIRVYESGTKDGAFAFIQEIENLGSYPDYIDWIEVTLASSADDWFAIKWVDTNGAESALSNPFKGNTQSVVGEIAQRVAQRGVSQSNEIVVQETEAVTERYFRSNPYDVNIENVTHTQLVGLTYLVMARLIMLDITSGSSDSYTAGLVSQKSQTGGTDKMKFLNDLIAVASQYLGIPSALIMQLADIDPTGLGSRTAINWDHSRLALTVNYE